MPNTAYKKTEMKKLVLLILCCFIIACKTDKNKKLNIDATFVGLKDSTFIKLYKLSTTSSDKIAIDSTFSLIGNFSFQIENQVEPNCYRLIYKESGVNSSTYYIDFWAEQENIKITVPSKTKEGFKNMVITGSKLNDINKKFKETLAKYSSPEIREEMKIAAQEGKGQEVFNKYTRLMSKDQLKLIFENPNNLVTLSKILSYKNSISPDSLKLFYNQLSSTLQGSEAGKLLKEYSELRKYTVGSVVEDFEAFNVHGEKVKLSDYKGKIILLDFWASWCSPCHLQNKEEFTYLYKKYKDNNFEIISFSIDVASAREDWIKASIDDGINWVNISNLKGAHDPVAVQFQVNPIPNSFLIDQHGKIIQSFIGYVKGSTRIEDEIIKLLDK